MCGGVEGGGDMACAFALAEEGRDGCVEWWGSGLVGGWGVLGACCKQMYAEEAIESRLQRDLKEICKSNIRK